MNNKIIPVVVLWFLHEEISTEKVPFLDAEEAIAEINRYLTEYGSEDIIIFVDKENIALHRQIETLSTEILGHPIEIFNL